MFIFKRITIFFLLLAFCIASLPIEVKANSAKNTSANNNQVSIQNEARKPKINEPAEIDSSESYSSGVVSSILESQERSIVNMEIEVQSLREEVQEDLPKLRAIRLQIDSEFNSINLINEASAVNPVEMSLLAKQMRRFNYELNNYYAPFVLIQQQIKNRLSQLASLENNLTTIDTDEAKSLLQRIEELNTYFKQLDARLTNALPKVSKLVDSITTTYNVFEQSMPSLWLEYYLHNTIDLLNINFWENELYSLINLPYSIALTFISGLPADLNQWGAILLSTIGALLIIAFIYLVTSKIEKRLTEAFKEKWDDNLSQIIKASIPWIVFGTVLYLSAWSDAGYYQIIAGFSIFCLAYGQIKLAWQLYMMRRENINEVSSPFMPMLAIIIVSFVLLTLIPLQLTLSLLWIVFLVLFLIYSRNRTKTSYSFPRFLLRVLYFFLILGILLTLAGYVHLSIFLTLSYICICVGIHQVSSFLYVSNIIQEKLPQNGIPALVSGLILSIVLPIILLIGFVSPLAWILVYPGGEYLVMNFGNFAIGFGKFSFNATQILSILIAFYLVKSLITVCCNYIDNTWSHNTNSGAASLSTPIKTVIIFGLWGIFGLYVLRVIGFSLASLAFVAGGLSVGIGLGLQSIMQNIFSGFSLIFGQNIREGDVVEVAGIMGVVKKVSLRATQVRTYDNAVVFVPNSEFLSTTFVNWTHNGRVVRSTVAVGVAYDSDLDLVKELAKKVLEEHPKVLAHPEPLLLVMEFGASSIDFEFRFWIRDIDEGLSIRGDVRMALVKVFREHNIEIPFPQTDLHFRNSLNINQSQSK